jgi:hypothetical protein
MENNKFYNVKTVGAHSYDWALIMLLQQRRFDSTEPLLVHFCCTVLQTF